jgi:hypothetical protein
MLTIPFSHRFYAKWLDFGGIPLEPPTRLLGYTTRPQLSDDFREYDTKFWRGGYGIHARAEFFKLGPGPYLILFLATHTGNTLVSDSRYAPGWLHWTTAREPAEWRDEGSVLNAPERYRQARGQLVRIAYEPGRA